MPVTLHHAHPWDLTPSEAIAVQKQLAPLVREERLDLDSLTTVGGLDVSVREDRVRAAAVVIRLADMETVDEAIWEAPVAFPYVPGLLSFREVPALLPALEQLRAMPDAWMLDAQGRAHPRRFGLACHLGVLLDCPALGVAKTLLVGRYANLEEEKGSTVDLVHRGEVVGRAVRTREKVNPVFVSVGHRITLDDAVALALRLTGKTKLPEPTRRAHNLSYRGQPGA
ncbi:MAG TPA: endonuclease V [Rubricoccaceae bacterium]|nr:endonuclease V [Rubricoccaceae bacterium]